MSEFSLLGQNYWHLFGIDHPLTSIDSDVIKTTWLIILIIFFLSLICRYLFSIEGSVLGFLVKKFVESFIELSSDSLGRFSMNYYLFITSIFVFILFCNWIVMIPGLEEPTRNLNTTLGLAIASFLYIQISAIKEHGFISYIKEYFAPFAPMVFLNVMGELSGILSLAFRLFGNIIGGSIIHGLFYQSVSGSIVLHTILTLTGLPIVINVFFVLFEGLLQAFVFSLISLTNLSASVAYEEEE